MERELNNIEALNVIYNILKQIHVSGDEDIIAMADCFRALSAVIRRMKEEQAAKDNESKEQEDTPPHKRDK